MRSAESCSSHAPEKSYPSGSLKPTSSFTHPRLPLGAPPARSVGASHRMMTTSPLLYTSSAPSGSSASIESSAGGRVAPMGVERTAAVVFISKSEVCTVVCPRRTGLGTSGAVTLSSSCVRETHSPS